MSPWQIIRQLQYLLTTRTWASTGSTVFGKVLVTNDAPEDLHVDLRMPVARLSLLGTDQDPEFPEITTARFGLTIVAPGRQDQHGQAALIGGARSDLTTSAGRGVMEIAAEVFSTLQRNDAETGISVLSFISRGAQTTFADGNVYGVQDLELEARGGSQLYYHPARRFVTSGNAMTWTLPPDRFDRYKMVLRYASGATAPTSVSGGTGATLSADLATSFTHTAGAGQFSYALFSQYDERRVGTTLGTSATATSASVTLTATFT